MAYHRGEEPVYMCADHEQCRHLSTCPGRLLSPKSYTWCSALACKAPSPTEGTHNALITILNGYSDRSSAAAALVL